MDESYQTHERESQQDDADKTIVAKDKENSEPMDASDTVVDSSSDAAASTSATSARGPPATGSSELVSQVRCTPQRNSSRSSLVRMMTGTPELMRLGTPQSLSQIISNLPSSGFSFDLPELQSPFGSGFLSPIGSAKMGKKRPLSISPLSSSSVNIDALVRQSPTSLLNYFASSRSSSAGSFGHLSPSLYANPVFTGYNRPVISLAKAVHPAPAASLPSSMVHSLTEEGEHDPAALPRPNKDTAMEGLSQIKEEPQPDVAEASCSQRAQLPHDIESSDGEGAQTDQLTYSEYSSTITESESEPAKRSSGEDRRSHRIYYSYPAVEQPHNNCCLWENCEKQSDSLDALVRHVNSEHIYQESRKDFVCQWRGCVREKRPFKAQYMLLVHMRRHTGEKPHKCHYEGCEKAYSRLENLKTHLRSHTGERPYTCKYDGCGKAFSNASDCAKHMNRTHSDEKPYACLNPGCCKRYTDPSSRRKHMKNCQINKRARTGEVDVTSGMEESATETGTVTAVNATKPSPSSSRKNSRARKSERKKKNEDGTRISHAHFAAMVQMTTDQGYFSGGSQSVGLHPQSFVHPNTGYGSSGYDTEYPSLTEESTASTLSGGGAESQELGPMLWPGQSNNPVAIKSEFYSHPSSQGSLIHHLLAKGYEPHPPFILPAYSQQRSRASRFVSPKLTSTLQTLPEIQQHAPIGNSYPRSHSFQPAMQDTQSSGYSSFGNSPVLMATLVSGDDATSLASSGHQGSLKSGDMTSSRSSFSTISSRVSSPCSTSSSGGGGGGGRDLGKPLTMYSTYPPHHRHALRRPNHILNHPAHGSFNSIPVELRGPHAYPHRQSDEVSLRSSHSSRYSVSGSDYSDDFGPAPPLPDPHLTNLPPRQPLPLPESMQTEFLPSPNDPIVTESSHPSGYSNGMDLPSPATSFGGGAIPLQHYEPPIDSTVHKASASGFSLHTPPGEPLNMVVGSMSSFADQLQQQSALFESLVMAQQS